MRYPFSRAVFIPLFIGDLLLIGGDALHRQGILADPRLLVTTERGFGELFQYLKFGATATSLAVSSLKLRSLTLLMWATLFVAFAADDAFALHERVGERLSLVLGLPPIAGARPAQIGELLFAGVVGMAGLVGMAGAFRRTTGPVRQVSVGLSVAVAALMFFGVGVDLLHSIGRRHPWIALMAVIEDGGEMLAASLGLAVARGRTSPPPTGPVRPGVA